MYWNYKVLRKLKLNSNIKTFFNIYWINQWIVKDVSLNFKILSWISFFILRKLYDKLLKVS